MGKKSKGAAIGAAVGAGVALLGIPLAFDAIDLAAGSAAAMANGGGMPMDSTVAVLQSIEAAAFSLAAKFGLATVGRSVGAAVGALLSKKLKKLKKPKKPKKPDDISDNSDDDEPKGDRSSGQPWARPGGNGQPRFR